MSIVVVSTLLILFFESERLRMVDQRLETVASSLLASGLSLSMIQNLESTDDLISDLLGVEKVDHIINIYDTEGQVLAQNFTATEIPLKFSRDEVHQSYDVNGMPVRVLNIKRGRLMIQVGVLRGPGWFNWLTVVNARFALFAVFIFTLMVVAAYFSSAALFHPLRTLTFELRSMSRQLDRKLGQPLSGFVIGTELSQLARRSGKRMTRDEFEILCAEIDSFLHKLEEYTRSFNAQSALLTHELKTPLTILKNILNEIERTREPDRVLDLAVSARHEIDRLTGLINDYLQWSVLSSNPARPAEIYAVKVSEVANSVVEDLNSLQAGRIRVETSGDPLVFALPDHVRQLLTNLLGNAVNYSTGEVVCRVSEGALEVADHGPGLPPEVREHLGSPFNRGVRPGTAGRGSGLGLAWVFALCEKYGWKIAVSSDSTGTRIQVNFA